MTTEVPGHRAASLLSFGYDLRSTLRKRTLYGATPMLTELAIYAVVAGCALIAAFWVQGFVDRRRAARND